MGGKRRPSSIEFRGRTIDLEPVAWMVGNCPIFDHLPVDRSEALVPLHDVTDWDKAIALAGAIEDEGWRGAPLVVRGRQLLTGTHRYMACELIGAAAPTIEIADVFAEAGLDLDAEIAELGFGDEWAALDALLCVERERAGYGLPGAVRAKYGIDWD
jgi:hypothetical protein